MESVIHQTNSFLKHFRTSILPAKPTWISGLLEIKNRAVKEHVSYIETMFLRAVCTHKIKNTDSLNILFEKCNAAKDEAKTMLLLENLDKLIQLYHPIRTTDTATF